MRLRNPFRKKCCAVPLLVAEGPDAFEVGSAVSGVAEIEGLTIEFVGVIVDPDEDEEPPTSDALLAARKVLKGDTSWKP